MDWWVITGVITVSRSPPTFPMYFGSAKAHRDFFNYFLYGILPTINHVSAKNRSNSAEN
jgi:hypothetical protein